MHLRRLGTARKITNWFLMSQKLSLSALSMSNIWQAKALSPLHGSLMNSSLKRVFHGMPLRYRVSLPMRSTVVIHASRSAIQRMFCRCKRSETAASCRNTICRRATWQSFPRRTLKKFKRCYPRKGLLVPLCKSIRLPRWLSARPAEKYSTPRSVQMG